MAKTDPTPVATPEPGPAAAANSTPTRAEILAANESANAERAIDGHVSPKHLDDITLSTGE